MQHGKPQIGDDVQHAAQLLRGGEVVAFATETVYGLAAAVECPRAVAKMYALKKRPQNHPSIVHLHSFADAAAWAEISPAAQKLAKQLMPGALTLLLPAKSGAPKTAVSADGLVALRVPAHPLARQLLEMTAGGVLAPSANRFGGVSPTTALHVAAEFADSPLYILDGGACQVGLESAIVSCIDDKVAVVRPGMLSAAEIAQTANTTLSAPPKVAAPGQLVVHYAPRKPLHLADSKSIADLSQTAAVLSRCCPPQVPKSQWRQSAQAADDYARQLYALLRELDATDAECIVVEKPSAAPHWDAVHDRLMRAST